MAGDAEARALRRQVREWRRGRADTRLADALSDAYIAVFATVMLGSMAVSVVVHARTAVTAACATPACSSARAVLPWATVGGLVTLTLVVARTVGPLMVSPADAAWLLSTPVDRGALLRPRLVIACTLSLLGGGLFGALAFALGGVGAVPATLFTCAVAAACVCAVTFAALGQIRDDRLAAVATWVLGAAVWVGLLVLALHAVPGTPAPVRRAGPVSVVVAAWLWLLAVGLTWRTVAHMPRLHRDRLTPGGSLLPSLSGALANLDLALMYDILLERRWRARATVRPARGGPGGAMALVRRDMVRLRRSPASAVLLAASLVLPYVAAALGFGALVTVAGALTAFLAGISLCTGLRVLARTPALVRCLPMTTVVARTAGLTVPALVLLAWGLASSPAVHEAMAPVSWPGAVAVGVAVGLAALAALARWVAVAPPDYSRPLVSSPAGAIPTTLVGSLARGLDVLLLLTAPLLFASPATGAAVSLALGIGVLGVVLGRSRDG